jgi:hypothetical protein
MGKTLSQKDATGLHLGYDITILQRRALMPRQRPLSAMRTLKPVILCSGFVDVDEEMFNN